MKNRFNFACCDSDLIVIIIMNFLRVMKVLNNDKLVLIRIIVTIIVIRKIILMIVMRKMMTLVMINVVMCQLTLLNHIKQKCYVNQVDFCSMHIYFLKNIIRRILALITIFNLNYYIILLSLLLY